MERGRTILGGAHRRQKGRGDRCARTVLGSSPGSALHGEVSRDA